MVKFDERMIDLLACGTRSVSKLVNYNITTMFIKLVLRSY